LKHWTKSQLIKEVGELRQQLLALRCEPGGPADTTAYPPDGASCQADSEPHKLAEHFREAIDNASEGFAIYDTQNYFLYANKRYREMFSEIAHLLMQGVHREEIRQGFYAAGGIPGAIGRADESMKEMEQQRMSGKRPELQHADGTWVKYYDRVLPDGSTVSIRTDITDIKRREEALETSKRLLQNRAQELKLARDEARAANNSKSDFLAAMSHELRTPLNAIIGFSEAIKNEIFGTVGNVKYREYTNDIHESGQHLLSLINDILDLSKIEAGKDELHDNEIEITKIAHAALKLVGHHAEQGGIKLEIEHQDKLPALRADERKLKQILVNLLSNAVKFSNSGGKVTLKAWCRMDSGYVFQIVDTGIGIAPEDIAKALSRFGQVNDGLNRPYAGTGLGLPLTKSLVEQHGGTLDLQSNVGIGTTVTVRFPAERIVASPNNSINHGKG